MKRNKFAYLYSKPLGNHALKIKKNNEKNTCTSTAYRDDARKICSAQMDKVLICFYLFH